MTLRALTMAAAGGQVLLRRMNVLVADLLHTETSGYKRTDMSNPSSPTVKIDTGTLRATSRDLDVAIDGDGYFRVQLPDGTAGFTRAGHLSRNAQGSLTNADGRPLDPPVYVPSTVTKVLINPLGHVQGFDPARPESLIPLGHLQLSRFSNPSGLRSVTGTLFRETPESGDRIDGRPGEVGGFLRQGYLELSNVNPVRELAELLQIRRAFELNARAFQIADQALQSVNNLRRKS
jgi:flagellar basal-body rod protein FlgG